MSTRFVDDFDDEDVDVDKCMGCGHYYAYAHAGARAWDQEARGSIAPQLCRRCWKQHGYPWPKEAA